MADPTQAADPAPTPKAEHVMIRAANAIGATVGPAYSGVTATRATGASPDNVTWRVDAAAVPGLVTTSPARTITVTSATDRKTWLATAARVEGGELILDCTRKGAGS